MADPIINNPVVIPSDATVAPDDVKNTVTTSTDAASETNTQKTDQFQIPLSGKDRQVKQMMLPGSELGRKVVYQQVPREGLRQESRQPQLSPQRPAPQTTPQLYRQVAQDRLFRQPAMQQSPVFRHVQQKSLPQLQQQPVLSRQHLAQMVALRNQAENKQAYRQVLRQEIHDKRMDARKADAMQNSARGDSDAFSSKQNNFITKVEQGEDGFEGMLKKMLSGDSDLPQTPQGKTANFLAKTAEAWDSLFTNMAKMGNVPAKESVSVQQILQSLFRGLYKQASQGMTLVSDLHYQTESEKVIAEKFVRILIDNPDLLEKLQSLQPGDAIPEEILKAFGEEVQFTQMVHVPDQMSEEARQLAREANFAALRNPVNTSAQERLSEKMKQSRDSVNADAEGGKGHAAASEKNEAEFRGVLYDPRWDRQERFGKPKGWVFFVSVFTALFLLILIFVWRRSLF